MNDNCANCDKDFCQCVKQSLSEVKAVSHDYKVSATLKWLKKHKIYYGKTATPNVVKLGGRPMIYISLISETSDKRGDRKIKLRRDGSAWQTVYSSEVLHMLQC